MQQLRFQNKTLFVKFMFFSQLFVIVSCLAFAQQKLPKIQYDTVKLKTGDLIVIGNRTAFIRFDTVIFIPDTSFYKIKRAESRQVNRQDSFYVSLRKKAYQTRVSKELYDLVFTSSASIHLPDTADALRSEYPFLGFSGKTIRSIHIQKLDVFGEFITDTGFVARSSLEKFGNNIHIKTKDYVIRSNLLFKANDTINPYTIADNERLLRQLPFIEDAKIFVLPDLIDTSLVDVVVVTKDVWSLAFDAKFFGLGRSKMSIYDVNLFGQGQYLRHTFNNNFRKKNSFQYEEGLYRVENILGSFITGYLRYSDKDNKKQYSVDLSRTFVTPATKYAGGMDFSKNELTKSVLMSNKGDTAYYKVRYDSLDVWAGRAFVLKSGELFKNRLRLVVAARYINKRYFKRPPVFASSDENYYNRNMMLGSLALISQDYYTGNLIYNFGRTEDIPYGNLFAVSVGRNIDDYNKQLYTGFKLGKAFFDDASGYYNATVNIGGYLNNTALNNGVLKLDMDYFTNLYSSDFTRIKFRHFATINYMIGIKQPEDAFIRFTGLDGIRGFSKDSLQGKHRLSVNLESVAFTPLEVVGFHFSMFGFVDMGWIGTNSKFILSQPMYTGLGCGIRIRNENLIFKTFQIRFAWYPKAAYSSSHSVLQISGEESYRFDNMNYTGPEIVKFE
jgi:hypothetical protein